MQLSVDLHSHSGASGGVGVISLPQVAETMKLKGIGVFGTGDCLHDKWLDDLETVLAPAEEGLYALRGTDTEARFLAQTEIIITAPVPCGGRKSVHTVILFPSFAAAREVARLMDKWDVKRTIGRPFLKCEDRATVAERLLAIKAVDDAIEIIPAHVLTPKGIYGSDNPVDCLADFFGEAQSIMRVVETGLSADPVVLALIPELDNRTLISNSDCHCGALNRVGREYTTLEVKGVSYDEIISALREGHVVQTAEFTPAEGRYFLTGHRAGRKGHRDGSFCTFSPDTVPADDICPICGKPLTVGVLQRALHLSEVQGDARRIGETVPRQAFRTMVPLVEVLAAGVGVRSAASKKVLAIYAPLMAEVGGEVAFWDLDDSSVDEVLARQNVAGGVREAVMHVRAGRYTFDPLGYDGEYGQLALNKTGQWTGISIIQRSGA